MLRNTLLYFIFIHGICTSCAAISEQKQNQLFQAVMDRNYDVIIEHVRENPYNPNPVITTQRVIDTQRDMIEEDHNTLLHIVSKMGQRTPMLEMLRRGVDPNIRNAYGETPLHKSTKHGHAQITEDLLCYQANPVARNLANATPYQTALERAKRHNLYGKRCDSLIRSCRTLATYPIRDAYAACPRYEKFILSKLIDIALGLQSDIESFINTVGRASRRTR